eukprot:gene20282-48029_t
MSLGAALSRHLLCELSVPQLGLGQSWEQHEELRR